MVLIQSSNKKKIASYNTTTGQTTQLNSYTVTNAQGQTVTRYNEGTTYSSAPKEYTYQKQNSTKTGDVGTYLNVVPQEEVKAETRKFSNLPQNYLKRTAAEQLADKNKPKYNYAQQTPYSPRTPTIKVIKGGYEDLQQKQSVNYPISKQEVANIESARVIELNKAVKEQPKEIKKNSLTTQTLIESDKAIEKITGIKQFKQLTNFGISNVEKGRELIFSKMNKEGKTIPEAIVNGLKLQRFESLVPQSTKDFYIKSNKDIKDIYSLSLDLPEVSLMAIKQGVNEPVQSGGKFVISKYTTILNLATPSKFNENVQGLKESIIYPISSTKTMLMEAKKEPFVVYGQLKGFETVIKGVEKVRPNIINFENLELKGKYSGEKIRSLNILNKSVVAVIPTEKIVIKGKEVRVKRLKTGEFKEVGVSPIELKLFSQDITRRISAKNIVTPEGLPVERGTFDVYSKIKKFNKGELEYIKYRREKAGIIKGFKGKSVTNQEDIYFPIGALEEGGLSKTQIKYFSDLSNEIAGKYGFTQGGSALSVAFEKNYKAIKIGDLDLIADKLKVEKISDILKIEEKRYKAIDKRFKVDITKNELLFGKEKVGEFKSGINQEILNLDDIAPQKVLGLDMSNPKTRRIGKARGYGAGDKSVMSFSSISITSPPIDALKLKLEPLPLKGELESLKKGGVYGKITAKNQRGLKDIPKDLIELRNIEIQLKASKNPINKLRYELVKGITVKSFERLPKDVQSYTLRKMETYSKYNAVTDKPFKIESLSKIERTDLFNKQLNNLPQIVDLGTSLTPQKGTSLNANNLKLLKLESKMQQGDIKKQYEMSSSPSRSVKSLSYFSSLPSKSPSSSPSRSISSLSSLSPSPSKSPSKSPSRSISSLSSLSPSPSKSPSRSRSPSKSKSPSYSPSRYNKIKEIKSFIPKDFSGKIYVKKLPKAKRKNYYTPTLLGLEYIRKTDKYAKAFKSFSGLEVRGG